MVERQRNIEYPNIEKQRGGDTSWQAPTFPDTSHMLKWAHVSCSAQNPRTRPPLPLRYILNVKV